VLRCVPAGRQLLNVVEQANGALHLKKGREKPVVNHHPWIFSGAIQQVTGRPQPGDLVDVFSAGETWLARGYYNPHSAIRCRLLSWDTETIIDDEFWAAMLERAITGRAALDLEPETNAYRLVNGEADGLPGLIVDQYAGYLVVQCATLGIDRRKELLFSLLGDRLHPAGIIERSDVAVREKEGLTQVTGLRHGTAPPEPVPVRENGHNFRVFPLEGQKTGFYLDQRDNRALVGQDRFVAGKTVLNTFSYTGAFAVYAAAGGAQAITNVDSATGLLTEAQQNMVANDFTGREADEYINGDAFQVLRHYRDTGRTFDVVILDPPKFAHSKRDVNRACRGYKDLNWLAMRLLRPGGLLATFSCSGLVSADLFQKVVFSAAVDAGRDAQILYTLGQGPDHPTLLTFPESAYLKGLLCRIW
jgi:23S rRNA (cytosine1962-C5)-methyltransferase